MPSSVASASGVGSPSRKSASANKLGRPLQICEIDFEENAVNCNSENLAIVEENLKKMSEYVGNPDLKVGVIAVMGMYRTGKSFLLDLLMRYLRQDGPITKFNNDSVWAMGMKTYETENFTWITDNAAPGDVEQTTISEGRNQDNERGFAWRSGIDKCTKGLWLWSKPFLLDHSGSDPLAILVLDTQGAWDSQMSSEHSACIFGITGLLSSKLIYNLQNRISEEKIDNLDYFTTFASIVLQEARDKAAAARIGGSPTDDEDEEATLGDLHFLVRDWEYFEDGWTLDKCTKQVSQHLMTHLDPNNVTVEERRETIGRLHNLFRSVNLCCLPHPGVKIPKANWRGNVTDVDTDFLYLLTHFFANLSHGEYPLKVAAPLGQELTVTSFCRVIEELVEAFRNAKPDAISLRKAFVNCEVFRAKDEAIQSYQRDLNSLGGIQEPENLEEFLALTKQRHLEMFRKRINPLFQGQLSEEDARWKADLVVEIEMAFENQKGMLLSRNQLLYSQATLKLVATPVIGLPVCMTFLTLPHILVYMLLAGGGVAHLNARSGDEGPKGWLDPSVIEKVIEDIKQFGEQRIVDARQMIFVGRNYRNLPNQFLASLGNTAELIPKAPPGAFAGAVAAAGAAGAAAQGVALAAQRGQQNHA